MTTKKTPSAELVPVDTQAVATSHSTRAQARLAWAKAIEVDPSNIVQVGSILTDLKAEASKVEAELKKITKPQNDALKAVRDFFRPAMNAYAEIESVLKTKIANAQAVQYAINRKATEAAQAALLAGDARGAALAANVIEDTSLPSNISVRETWQVEVVDEALVPRELCSSDMAKIRAYVQAWGDKVQIPGVRISRGSVVTVRQA